MYLSEEKVCRRLFLCLTRQTMRRLSIISICICFLWSNMGFATEPVIAELTSPLDGATEVPTSGTFTWTAVEGAEAYYLYVGSVPGAKDLVDTGAMQRTRYTTFAHLPRQQTLYATIWTRIFGKWYYHSSSFTTKAGTSEASSMIFPTDGAMDVEIAQPFQWQEAGNSNIYRLIIGSADGMADICDSGEIDISRYFVPALPTGQMLYGQLLLRVGESWAVADRFGFTVSSQYISADTWIESAHWAADRVRRMADDANRPDSDTLLDGLIYPKANANCADYSLTLLVALDQMNMALDSRTLNVFFNYGFDAHTLVELYNPDQQSWILVDPTFSLAMRRASDGLWATAEDMMDSVRGMRWDDVLYVYLGNKADGYAKRYYMDYPLLFMNIWNESMDYSQVPSIRPYFTQVSVPMLTYGTYAIRTSEPDVAHFTVQGIMYSIECMGVDNFSYMFHAESIDYVPEMTLFELYKPNRYVFK